MSVAAARSPSPGPAARPCCGLRRSADSSPFKPAASRPESPQRSSSVCKNGSGRASPRPFFPEKENDAREPARTHKARSSGVGCGGGGVAKSFMAPTISAASKAVAPSASPRTRILGERNDPVPLSPGDLAHGAKPRGAPPPPPEAAPLGAPRRLRLSFDGAPALPPAAAPPASHLFGGDEEAEDPVRESRQDGGLAAAPYDPKTNYLSPRPRFLRYKPNPRVEMYRHSGGGGVRRLEEGFASESSSDTATTTEEDVSEEEREQTTLSSVLDDFTEEDTSALAPAPEAGVEPAASAVAGVLQPHPAPDSPLPRVLTTKQKESPRAGGVLPPEQEPAASPAPVRPKKKKRSPLRFLLGPFALVLFVAAALVCVPPPPGSPVMLNTFPSKVSDFLLVQELHPVELAARLKQWSSSSLDFVTSYWEALASSQEQEVFGPHFAANLSAAPTVDADHAVGFYYGAAQTSPISVEQKLEIQEVVSESDTEMIATPDVEEMTNFGDAEVEEPIDDAEMEHESAVPSIIQEANDSVDAEVEEHIDDAEMEHESAVPSVIQEANDSVDAEVEEFNTEMKEVVSGSRGEEIAEEVSGSVSEERAAFIQNSDIPFQSAAEPEQAEDMAKSSLQQDVQTEDSESDRPDGQEDQDAHQGKKLGSDMWPSYLDKISNPAALGAAIAAIIVPAVLALLYIRKKQARVALDSNEPAEQVEQVEQVEKSLSGSGSSEGYVAAKSSQFQNPVVEESEKLGGSGASQYSSSLSSGLGRRRNAREEVSLGLEPVVSRGDSTAQSTASYGSFTTYEKIPAKKGNKEDEAMTPVRRSRRNVKPPES
ncbi:uncharacterized protein C2845_PM01G32820 [Panicum miliaceum]|uniref:Uncharacterized protein n=1 Tax=Panicum miliaceum TaxID=4540 RepID=A0A3L6TT63_PANMI|nr:uncharacterized protein C2845_PM01G32820 [Panicum miliaceum]